MFFDDINRPSAECRTFADSVPTGLLNDFGRLVIEAMRTAWSTGADLPAGIRHDRFSYDFRFNVEVGLLHLGQRYKAEGVTAREAANTVGNWHHSELLFKGVVLTASAVESPDTMVRDARFRRTLAKNPQLALGTVELEEDPPSDGLYAVLLYPSGAFTLKAEAATPSFVLVRFPTSDCSTYIGGRIDALAAAREAQQAAQAAPKRVERRNDQVG